MTALFGGRIMTLKDFKEMINRTLFCAISYKNAFYSGVLLKKSEGKLVMVATDNKVVGLAIKDVGDAFPDFDKVVIAPKILNKIAKRKRDTSLFSISVSEGKIYFHIGSAIICTELQPSNFPHLSPNADDFLKRFPSRFSFVVERIPFFEALSMVSAITDFQPLKVYFLLSNGLLSLQTFDGEDTAKVEVPCNYSGETTEFLLSSKYITEIIEHIETASVNIRIHGNKKIVVIPEPVQDYYFLLAQIMQNTNTNKEEKHT
jgi:DNA polymerase III sliding clamp (beta) subunit (PCNA family)